MPAVLICQTTKTDTSSCICLLQNLQRYHGNSRHYSGANGQYKMEGRQRPSCDHVWAVASGRLGSHELCKTRRDRVSADSDGYGAPKRLVRERHSSRQVRTTMHNNTVSMHKHTDISIGNVCMRVCVRACTHTHSTAQYGSIGNVCMCVCVCVQVSGHMSWRCFAE